MRVRHFAAVWYGFAVLRHVPEDIACDYWALAQAPGGWRLELAGMEPPADWTAFARALLRVPGDQSENMLAYHDAPAGQHRFAVFDRASLAGALFVDRGPVAVSRAWLTERLSADIERPADRLRLLAGRGGNGAEDSGAIVCGCFTIGVNQIVSAVRTKGCASVDAIGALLGAGTSCGSCRAEIQRIVRGTPMPKRAASHAAD